MKADKEQHNGIDSFIQKFVQDVVGVVIEMKRTEQNGKKKEFRDAKPIQWAKKQRINRALPQRNFNFLFQFNQIN